MAHLYVPGRVRSRVKNFKVDSLHATPKLTRTLAVALLVRREVGVGERADFNLISILVTKRDREMQ